MKKTALFLAAIFFVAIFLVTALPGPALSYGWFSSDFRRDINTLKGVGPEVKDFMTKYDNQIQVAQDIQSLYVSDHMFGQLRAGLKGVELVDTKEGRRFLVDGVKLYNKYDPPLKRILDQVGRRDEFGRISDNQIHRASVGAGLYGVFKGWCKRPFSFFFNPNAVGAAYRESYNGSQKGLEQYRAISEFMDGDSDVARLIRGYANLEGEIDFDDFDWEDLGKINIGDDQPRNDVFDPLDAFDQIERPRQSIIIDRTDDF